MSYARTLPTRIVGVMEPPEWRLACVTRGAILALPLRSRRAAKPIASRPRPDAPPSYRPGRTRRVGAASRGLSGQ